MSLGPWAVITWLVPVDPPNEIDTRLDWIGSFLMGVSLFLLLFGFSSSQTEKRGWATPCKPDEVTKADDPDVPVLIGGSVIFMICFVSRQIQLTKALASGTKAKPLIPRSLLSLDCWDLLVIYVAAVLIWACGDVSLSFSSTNHPADTSKTMWALLSYLYLDVMDLGAFESGLRLSTVLFIGLAAAVSIPTRMDLIHTVSSRSYHQQGPSSTSHVRFMRGVSVSDPDPEIITSKLMVSISLVLLAVHNLDWPFWWADLWAMLFSGFNADW